MVQPNIMQDRLQELFPVHYRNGNILMINADCMEVMKHIKEKEAELSCVDPPYGINIISQFNKSDTFRTSSAIESKEWDSVIPSKEYFHELKRVSANQIIWGGNYFLDYLGKSAGFAIWDKMNGTNPMADAELAWTSFEGATRMFRMHHFSAGYEPKIHPTQKPVALYTWLLSRYAKPGDKILDTHGGSGSICIACHDLGYDLTWMELDADYYKAACERYRLHASQAQLFEPVPQVYTQGEL